MSLTNTSRVSDGVARVGGRVRERARGAAAQAGPAGRRAGAAVASGTRQGVYVAREWAAPRLDDAAAAVEIVVAPQVSSALRTTAAWVRPVPPAPPARTGILRMLDWRWLAGIGAAVAAAGGGTAFAMRRRYANATAQAKNDTEPSEGAGEADAATGSDVNGRVNTPGS